MWAAACLCPVFDFFDGTKNDTSLGLGCLLLLWIFGFIVDGLLFIAIVDVVFLTLVWLHFLFWLKLDSDLFFQADDLVFIFSCFVFNALVLAESLIGWSLFLMWFGWLIIVFVGFCFTLILLIAIVMSSAVCFKFKFSFILCVLCSLCILYSWLPSLFLQSTSDPSQRRAKLPWVWAIGPLWTHWLIPGVIWWIILLISSSGVGFSWFLVQFWWHWPVNTAFMQWFSNLSPRSWLWLVFAHRSNDPKWILCPCCVTIGLRAVCILSFI